MNQVTRREFEHWLLKEGFVETAGGKTSHRQFVKLGHRITLPGRGPQDLTKKHVGLLLRALARAGYDPAMVRRELSS